MTETDSADLPYIRTYFRMITKMETKNLKTFIHYEKGDFLEFSPSPAMPGFRLAFQGPAPPQCSPLMRVRKLMFSLVLLELDGHFHSES